MKKQKPHLNRNAYISEHFRDFLRKNIAGFALQPDYVQMELTRMIKQAPARYREHSHYPGCSFFSFDDLEAKFGRGKFNLINEELGIFLTKEDWSKIEGRTKPYKLAPHIAELHGIFFAKPIKVPTNLLAENGDVRHKAPDNAIIAKRMTKTGILVTKQGWRGFPVRSAVPVDQVELEKLANSIRQAIAEQKAGLRHDVDLKHANYVLTDILLILHQSHNTVAPGCVIHRYEQSASGRLYAHDVNLQTSHRQVRYAALNGLYDYDIENCHYDILRQMAEKAGHECTAVSHYLDNKGLVRRTLAKEFGITIKQVKKVLLMLVYGASLSDDPDAAIPEEVGVDVAVGLYGHQFFNDMAKDIASARTAILRRTKIFRGGIRNMRGLEMKVKRKKDRHLLAHLLQGVESVALEAAHNLYASEIVLLQHDGFTATTPDLDIAAIEKAIFVATKYRLKLSIEEQIKPDLNAALIDTDKFSIPNQNLLEAAPTLGLPHSLVG